jgi:hypothetical protein
MSDLSHLLQPRTYPHAWPLIRDSFAPQPDGQTCGAAALRHGLLLGGLFAPVGLLESLLEIRKNTVTDEPILLKCLRRLGFEAEPVYKKPRKKRTAAFLDELRPALDEGAFLLPCPLGWQHWVCLGAWDGERAWVVDSSFGTWAPPWDALRLGFFGYTEQEFDEQKWWDWIIVVRPGTWTDQYKAWLPARHVLLRTTEKDGPDNPVSVDYPTSVEAAVQIAAHQYLDHDEYAYCELDLYLSQGVGVTVRVKDPGKDAKVGAVLVDKVGEGDDRVFMVRRACGTLTQRRTPPELVLRAGQLRAAQLG